MAHLPLNWHTIAVHARCGFPSWSHAETPWRDQDRDWQLLVLAVKDDKVRMKERYASLPIGSNGEWMRVDKSQTVQAGRWFGKWAAAKVRGLGITDPVFVAIPNRKALQGVNDFRTATLAQSAAEAFGAGAAAYTGLRFRTLVSKEEKKRQNPAELIANMVVVEELPPAGTLVFLDDIFTQGHHLTAACSFIQADRRPVLGLVCGRTVLEPKENMGAEIEVQHIVI